MGAENLPMERGMRQGMTGGQSKANILQRWLLGVPLILLPFWYAGVRPLAWGGVAGIFFIGTTLLVWTDRGLELFAGLSRRWALVLGCFLLYPLLQVVPLPLGWLIALDPERARWIHQAAEVTGLPVSFAGLSYVPVQTVVADFRWIFLLVFALVLRKTLREERSVDWLFTLLFCVATFEVLYGLLQVLIPSLGIPGVTTGAEGVARGTFVNRNNYACFLGMLWPLLLGHLLGLNPASNKAGSLTYHEKERRRQLQQKQWFLGLLIGLVLLALFFSRSRGGILSSLVALTVFVVFGRVRGKGLSALVAGSWLVMLAYGTIIGFEGILARFDQIGQGASGRFQLWKDALPIVRDHWLTGTGLGSFGTVYKVYQHHLGDTLQASFAHNDYLQLAVELGVPVAIGIVVLVWGYWWKMALKLRKRREANNERREARGERRGKNSGEGKERRRLIAVGALAGGAAFLCHSWVDFNWQIPADALYFVMLLVLMRGEKRIGLRTED